MKYTYYYLTACVVAIGSLVVLPAVAQQRHSFTTDSTASSSTNESGSSTHSSSGMRIGVVNTKKCLEESKLAKQEQVNFEKLKKQMESVLQEKEKALESIDAKLNDEDWLESGVSEERISEERRKRKALREEGMQLQQQYMQTLQQVNAKSVDKLTAAIAKASAQVAEEGVDGQFDDVILTDEACLYYAKKFDRTIPVINRLNASFDAESKS